MRSFDWIIYALVLGVLVTTVFAGNRNADVPDTTPNINVNDDGPMLPPPSILDEQVLVQVEAPKDGIGTAFAVNQKGQWITARHVVDGCDSVGLLVGPNQYVPVSEVTLDTEHDLALLQTDQSLNAVTFDLGSPFTIGSEGFLVGYPQGVPGEVATRLMSRSRLISRGRRTGEEEILAWAEIGRTKGLDGSLGGISGGPLFDTDGEVRGVVVAESPRRGRIYTAAPDSIEAFLTKAEITTETGPVEAFSTESYGSLSDSARRKLQVVKVACKVIP